jgi:predicted ArsR family transcriptional regulator
MGIHDLAAAVRRRPNSVREQLVELMTVGLVLRSAAPAAGRGRPAFQYVAAPGADEAQRAASSDDYRSLAAVLAGQIARLPGAAEASVSAGERWGSALAEGPAVAGDRAAVDRLIGILQEAGFAPDRPDPAGPIELHRCPFDPVARAQPGVVCGVHLGMIRGALATMGSAIDVERLDPFVRPDTCLAHLAARRPAPLAAPE